MPALASLNWLTTVYYSPGALMTRPTEPPPSEGEAGRSLLEIFEKIVSQRQSPQSLTLEPKLYSSPAPIPLLRHSLYISFYPLEPIQSVYVQPLPEANNVFVFLNQAHYDETLMDFLLDQESDILDQYPEILFNFHYLPLLDNNSPTVPENAILIFTR